MKINIHKNKILKSIKRSFILLMFIAVTVVVSSIIYVVILTYVEDELIAVVMIFLSFIVIYTLFFEGVRNMLNN